MGENVDAQLRTGITVVLVAMLITVVLNLAVIAQNIMSSGLGKVEAGIDQVLAQEFERYNQQKVSGTSVKTAISLYQAEDVAVVVRTKACIDGTAADGAWGYMYGSLVMGTAGTTPIEKLDTENNAYYTVPSGLLKQKAGTAFYEAEYYVVNGIIQVCNNTRGTITSGNSQMILESARFRSYLIKSATGATIGILFEQIS